MLTYRQARKTESGCRAFYIQQRDIAAKNGMPFAEFKRRVVEYVTETAADDRKAGLVVEEVRLMAWFSHVVANRRPPQ
jgi:hypothetical protein